MNTGSQLNDALRESAEAGKAVDFEDLLGLLGVIMPILARGGFFEVALEVTRPPFELEEDSLHRRGRVGKCIVATSISRFFLNFTSVFFLSNSKKLV